MTLTTNLPAEPNGKADHWLTVREAASYAQVSEHTIRRWLREGKLRRGGPNHRTIRIRRSWLDEFLERGYE